MADLWETRCRAHAHYTRSSRVRRTGVKRRTRGLLRCYKDVAGPRTIAINAPPQPPPASDARPDVRSIAVRRAALSHHGVEKTLVKPFNGLSNYGRFIVPTAVVVVVVFVAVRVSAARASVSCARASSEPARRSAPFWALTGQLRRIVSSIVFVCARRSRLYRIIIIIIIILLQCAACLRGDFCKLSLTSHYRIEV